MAAARAWAAGQLDAASAHPNPEPEAILDALRWEFDAGTIETLRSQLGLAGPAVSVWHLNVAAVMAFQAAATQWRTGICVQDGRLRTFWIGLDYAGARVSIAESELLLSPSVWTGIRIMEMAARDALNGEMVH